MILKNEEIVRFQRPLLLLFGWIFLGVLLFFVFSAYILQKHHNEDTVRRQLDSVDILFHQHLDLEAKLINVLIDQNESNPVLQKAFLAQKKDELLQAALPVFKKLNSTHDITHFYFINQDRTCFLRMHNPSRDGDFIDRYTMKEAERNLTSSHGVELGPYGTFSLRVVKPWIINGKPAGYLELSKEIHHITSQLKKILGLDFLFLVNKHHLKRESWQERLNMAGISGDWNEVEDHVVIDRTLPKVPPAINTYMRLSHEEKEGFIFKASLNDKKYHGGFAILKDAGGHEVGEIIALQEATRQVSALRIATIMFVSCIFLGAIIFFLFYTYTGRLKSRLSIVYQDLKDEIDAHIKTGKKLHQHEKNLEKIILDRTSKLEKEIAERSVVEKELLERETLLKKSQEIAHVGSWSLDLKNNILVWSDEVYRIFGVSPRNFLPGMDSFLQLVHPDDRDRVDQKFATAIQNKSPFNTVHKILRPDGTVRFVHQKSEEILDESGKTELSVGIIHDITEQVQSEKALYESDEQLRLLIHSSDDMISLHDFDGTYTYYNGPSRYSASPKDIIGKTPHDFFNIETADMLVAKIRETWQTEKRATYEIELDWFGEKTWFSEYIYPVFDPDGRITKVAKIRHNINELKQAKEKIEISQKDIEFRKQAEEKIRNAYSELDQIFNASVPLSVTKDYRIVKVNRAFCSYFGIREEEITGKLCHEFCGSEFCQTSECPMKNIFAGNETYKRDIDRIINGIHIICSIHAVPFRDENGQLLGIVSTFFDMADRKRAETNLKKTQNQLLHAEKLSAVGQLSASIAHEFNNPLQGVMTVLSGVKKRVPMDHANANLVELALNECNRMKHLINDLQDFNRPTSGVIAPMDIHFGIDNILLMAKKNLNIKEISIIKQYAANMPLIPAVADQIKQVVLNLINNASDTCPEGGTITISTELQAMQKNAIIRIQDTGVGMKPDDIKHIFEPFFTTKPAVKGIGLGLSVSYGIIKKHGGKIEVESEPGQGTIFTITLPLPGIEQSNDKVPVV